MSIPYAPRQRAQRAAPTAAPARPLFPVVYVPRWALVALVLGALALIVWLAASELRAALDPLERQARALELAREQQIAAQVAPVDVATAAAWRVLALVVAAATCALALAAGWRRWVAPAPAVPAPLVELAPEVERRATQPRPARPALDQPAAALALLDSPEDDAAPEVAPAQVVIPGPPPRLDPPTFADLLRVGLAGRALDPRRALVLGYSAERAADTQGDQRARWAAGLVLGGWQSLYSAGLGGLQGSGKTSTGALLLAQSALNGGRVLLLDPHAGDDQSLAALVADALAPALAASVATSAADVRAVLELVRHTVEQRSSGASDDRTPLILACDEWLRLLRYPDLAPLVRDTIDAVSTEGRKMQVHALLLSHRWTKEEIGPFRNSLAAAFVHRLRPEDAKMLTGWRAADLPGDLMKLQPGGAYLFDTTGDVTRVSVPYLDRGALALVRAALVERQPAPPAVVEQPPRPPEVARAARPARAPEVDPLLGALLDLAPGAAGVAVELAPEVEQPQPPAGAVASEVTSPAPAPEGHGEATAKRPGSDGEATSADTSSASESGAAHQPPSPEDVRIIALFRAGKDIPAIIAEVWNVQAGKGGQRYQELNRRVQSTLRGALGGGGA